jgi:MFS transporter, PHS family, inorganic phosphate transporter
LETNGAQIHIPAFLLAASLVALITIAAYKHSIIGDNFDQLSHVDYCWRILIGLGCVPGAIALYFRLTIPETPRFTMDIERDVQRAKNDIDNVLGDDGANMGVYWVDPEAVVQRAEAPRRSSRDFIRYFGQSSNLQLLFGVAYSWFAIDASFPFCVFVVNIGMADLRHHTARFTQVAFYGLGLNSSTILTSALLTRAGIGQMIDSSEISTTLGIYKALHNVAVGSLVVSVAGLLPGYYATFFLIDTPGWGRKRIQFQGFAMLTILLAILGKDFPVQMVFRKTKKLIFGNCIPIKLASIPVPIPTPIFGVRPRRSWHCTAWRISSQTLGRT